MEFFKVRPGCCTRNERKTSLCGSTGGWSALTVERASHSARSLVGTISIDASQTGFTCQGFWTSAKLAAPDSDRRTPGITLFYTALGLNPVLPRTGPSLTVWFYDAKFLQRPQMTDLRRWSRRRRRSWTTIRQVPFSLLLGILSRISGLDPVKPGGRNWSV